MIKDIIKGTAVYISLSAILYSSGATASDITNTNEIEKVIVEKLVYPTKPTTRTQLDELDKIILHYEGEREILEAQKVLEVEQQRTLMMSEWAESDAYIGRQEAIDGVIEELFGFIGVTEYGFGSTPDLWDCSGLTKWYLSRMDIEVTHSATAQVLEGTRVQQPVAGDLVAFQKYGALDYFHIGVYVGGGMMIHASNPEKDTNFQSIYEFANAENSKIVYVRY